MAAPVCTVPNRFDSMTKERLFIRETSHNHFMKKWGAYQYCLV